MADLQTVRDDIAFMRALAEEGRSAPLLGGSILVAAGAVFGAASLAHYGVDVSGRPLTPWIYPTLWLGAGLLFTVILYAIRRRYRGRPGSLSPGNRAMQGVWRGVGFAIFTLFVVLGVAGWKLDDPVVFGLFPSAVLVLYGAAWTLGAQMSEQKWMVGVAALSFLCAAAMPLLLGDAEMYLAYAAALALTAVLPGVLLMRQEPSDVV